MKLSFLVVTTDIDRDYNDLLLNSIKETVSLDESEYEIIIHDNSNIPMTGGQAHAIGLTEGYKKTKGETVLILDSDTCFLKNEWSKELLGHFDDSEVVFAAGMRCEIYSYPFYRSHFLAIRSFFYKDLIINKKGFFPVYKLGRDGKPKKTPKLENDVAAPITKYCKDNNKKYIHYKNSLNDDVPSIYQGPGETVYNSKGDPFFHHVGRGVKKHYRFEKWKSFVEKFKEPRIN
jgi:hypothetical protein